MPHLWLPRCPYDRKRNADHAHPVPDAEVHDRVRTSVRVHPVATFHGDPLDDANAAVHERYGPFKDRPRCHAVRPCAGVAKEGPQDALRAVRPAAVLEDGALKQAPRDSLEHNARVFPRVNSLHRSQRSLPCPPSDRRLRLLPASNQAWKTSFNAPALPVQNGKSVPRISWRRNEKACARSHGRERLHSRFFRYHPKKKRRRASAHAAAPPRPTFLKCHPDNKCTFRMCEACACYGGERRTACAASAPLVDTGSEPRPTPALLSMAAVYWWSVGYGAIVVFVSPASTWTGTVCQGFVGMVLTLAVIFFLGVAVQSRRTKYLSILKSPTVYPSV